MTVAKTILRGHTLAQYKVYNQITGYTETHYNQAIDKKTQDSPSFAILMNTNCTELISSQITTKLDKLDIGSVGMVYFNDGDMISHFTELNEEKPLESLYKHLKKFHIADNHRRATYNDIGLYVSSSVLEARILITRNGTELHFIAFTYHYIENYNCPLDGNTIDDNAFAIDSASHERIQ
jgi:hypothetical protein